MKRDWDTVREILLAIESLGQGELISADDFPGERQAEVAHHVLIMDEAGLIEAKIGPETYDDSCYFVINRLTWAGHDFLDAVRQDNVWSKTRSTIQWVGGGVTFEVVKQMAVGMIKDQIGI